MGFFDRVFRRSARAQSSEELRTILLPDHGTQWSNYFSNYEFTLHMEFIDKPFERDQLDLRFADGISHGVCHVRVLLEPCQQTISERTRALRHATELAHALVATGALGIVVHSAGEVLLPAKEWLRRTQGLAEPEWIPAMAWVDLGSKSTRPLHRQT